MNMPQEGLITVKTAINYLAMSRSSFYELLLRTNAITRVKIGPRTVRYRAEEVRAYVDTLSASNGTDSA